MTPMDEVPAGPYTLNEIAAHFPKLPIRETYGRYKLRSLAWMDKQYRADKIDDRTYDAYRAIWRNSTVRFSDVCIAFDIQYIYQEENYYDQA